jgi:hypothetical protein
MNQLGQAAQAIGKGHRNHHRDFVADQPAGAQRHYRSSARRFGRQGICGGRQRNQGTGPADRRATEDIKGRIAGVQSSTAGGIAEIEKISQVIHEVSDIVASIAAAIEEQATVTKDIARNIGEASTGSPGCQLAGGREFASLAEHRPGDRRRGPRRARNGRRQRTGRASAIDLSKLAEALQIYRVQISSPVKSNSRGRRQRWHRSDGTIMMKKLANLKIGRKLAISTVAAALQLGCLAGLSLWALGDSNSAATKALHYAHKMNLAQKLDSRLSEVALRMSSLPTSKHPGQDADLVLALRKDYATDLAYLKANATTDEDRGLLAKIDEVVVPWRDLNNQIMKTVLAGGRVDTNTIGEQSLDRFVA